jgi:hypothetical protein
MGFSKVFYSKAYLCLKLIATLEKSKLFLKELMDNCNKKRC